MSARDFQDAHESFVAAMTRCGSTREALQEVFKDWQPGPNHPRRTGGRTKPASGPSRQTYRAALEAIANSEIPGVSGGPHGPSREVMEFARRALRNEP